MSLSTVRHTQLYHERLKLVEAYADTAARSPAQWGPERITRRAPAARAASAEPRTAARAAETIGGRLLRLPRELTAPRGSALGASACARQWGVAPRAPAPLLFGATLSTLNNARGPTQGVTSDATSAPKKRGKSGHHDDAELPGGRGVGGAVDRGLRRRRPVLRSGVWCKEHPVGRRFSRGALPANAFISD